MAWTFWVPTILHDVQARFVHSVLYISDVYCTVGSHRVDLSWCLLYVPRERHSTHTLPMPAFTGCTAVVQQLRKNLETGQHTYEWGWEPQYSPQYLQLSYIRRGNNAQQFPAHSGCMLNRTARSNMIQRGFACGLVGRRSQARITPKILPALWRNVLVRSSGKGGKWSTHFPTKMTETGVPMRPQSSAINLSFRGVKHWR